LSLRFDSQRGNSKETVNQKLKAIRYYFNYLISVGIRKDNPAIDLKVRGTTKKVIADQLTEEELNSIYKNFLQDDLIGRRNKVTLGFLVYQGITTKEAGALLITDINLDASTVSISGTTNSNGRILALVPQQILLLNTYLTDTRPKILKLARKESDKLFVSQRKGDSITHMLKNLLIVLKSQNKTIKNLQQFRNSVIINLLKKYDVRKVQHMVGHKYASSTEKYQQNDLKDLQEDLEMYHPLR
jgi:site-specific recombinase XerD